MYLPDVAKTAYQELLDTLDREFTYTFGGATILRGVDGRYLSKHGTIDRDRVNLIYTDAPFNFEDDRDTFTRYAERVTGAVLDALEEDTVLVVLFKVYHVM